MIPFRVVIKKTVNKDLTQEQIDNFLIFSSDLLKNKGVDNLKKGRNNIKFENVFFKLGSNWNLMAYVDGGTLEITKNKEKTIIKYKIRFVKIWLLSVIGATIMYISSKEIITFFLAFSVLGIFTWTVSSLRHWRFFLQMISNSKML